MKIHQKHGQQRAEGRSETNMIYLGSHKKKKSGNVKDRTIKNAVNFI